MKLSESRALLRNLFQLPPSHYVTPILQSEPGVGKSDTVFQVSEELGFQVNVWRLGQTDAAEVGGLPMVENGQMRFALPDILPRDDDPPTVVFFDEFADAEKMVYNAVAEIILDKTLRGAKTFRLAPQHRIVAASNRSQDRAGARELPSHIRNRLMFLDIQADYDEWRVYAINKGLDEIVMGFLRQREGLLCKFDATQRSFPSPRSWEFVSKTMPAICGMPANVQLEVITGLIGDGPAQEFVGFMRLAQTVDADACLARPETYEIPSDPAVLYALCVSLAMRVTKKTADNLYKYLLRLPEQDFAARCVIDVNTRDASLSACTEGQRWFSKNAKLLVG